MCQYRGLEVSRIGEKDSKTNFCNVHLKWRDDVMITERLAVGPRVAEIHGEERCGGVIGCCQPGWCSLDWRLGDSPFGCQNGRGWGGWELGWETSLGRTGCGEQGLSPGALG